jgi:serine/threonine protein kinase
MEASMGQPDRIGDYEIIRSLGKPGGFGAVYEARAPDGAAVALKVFHAETLENTDRLRFRQEIKALGEVRHSNVVNYIDDGEVCTDERPYHYIVMELLHGRSLRQMLDDEGKLPAARAMEIARQIAHGLEALHQRGIVHRDLKPANVIVCDDGRVVLIDFGVSRFLDYTTVTRDGAFIGTLRYAAPEQLTGDAVPASDLHALGAILFEMVTGRRVFNAVGEVALLNQIREEVPDPAGAYAEVPGKLEALIAQLLEKEPLDRPGGADSLAEALVPVLSVPRGVARSPYPREQAPRIFVRVRHDVEAAISASLSGAVPDALIVSIRDSSTKPLTLARRAAQHHAISLGVDPLLMRMAFARWASTAVLRELAYAPSEVAPYLPRQLANRAAAVDLARLVVEAQADAGATMAFAAHFPVAARDDEWQRRNPSLLAGSIEAAKAFDLPLWAVAAVTPEVICSPDDQTEFVNRLVRGEPDGWLVCVDGLGSRAPETTVLWSLRLALLLQERGAPVVMARATSLRRLICAFGLGVEIGLGRYDGFRLSDMREGGGTGHSPPYFEIPELLCALPPEDALAVLQSEVLPRCHCPSCVTARNAKEQIANAPAHNAAIAMAERDAAARITPMARANELDEQIIGALAIEARLRRTGVLDHTLGHLRLWPKILSRAIEMGMLGDERLRRRLSA